MKTPTLAFVVVGSALFGAAAMVIAMVGYAFIQSQDNGFAVWIENDSRTPLLIKNCGDSCAHPHDEVRLLPGEKVAASATADIPNWWRVEDGFGHTLGCLPLLFGIQKPEAMVRTSQVQDCPP